MLSCALSSAVRILILPLLLLLALAAFSSLSFAQAPAQLPNTSTAAITTYTVQGDSLTVDSASFTKEVLKGWHRRSLSAQIGRHYWDGWPLLRKQPLGQVVIFALGTNDWQSYLSAYTSTIKKILAYIGPKRCLVMATIYDHGAINSWNRGLRKLAQSVGPRRMQVAEWARMVTDHTVKLADGVHPSRSWDWRLRGQVIADAAQACKPRLIK